MFFCFLFFISTRAKKHRQQINNNKNSNEYYFGFEKNIANPKFIRVSSYSKKQGYRDKQSKKRREAEIYKLQKIMNNIIKSELSRKLLIEPEIIEEKLRGRKRQSRTRQIIKYTF